MTEFELIYRYFASNKEAVANHDPVARHAVAPILKDLGDDAAVISMTSDTQWITCVDTLVQGRHFSADWAQVNELAFAIGFKAVAVNVSDVIAMGASPHSILLALALPQRLAQESWLNEFAKGLFHACTQFGVRLIGGDTTRHDSLVISITANGIMPKAHQPIYRSGAQVGDKIYVTGTLGDASYALHHLDNKIGQHLAHRLHMPTPRVAVAQALSRTDNTSWPTAMIDVSDGLVQDLAHICTQSHVTMRLNLEQLPTSKPLQSVELSERLQYQLTGGDDYELLFTMPHYVDMATIEYNTHTKITCIGEVIGTLNKKSVSDDMLNNGYAIELYYKNSKITQDNPSPFARYPNVAGFQHFNTQSA